MGITVERTKSEVKKRAGDEQKPSQILEKFFETKHMVFYRRDTDAVTFFILPYNIEKQRIEFSIKIAVFDEISLCQMSLCCEVNEDKDYSKELLSMNSELMKGRISVETDSNQVTYSLSFTLEKELEVETLYNKSLNSCVSVLASLYKKGIIKVQE